jgi:hypothetical protein
MPHCIARIFEQLLRLLLPARGVRRTTGKGAHLALVSSPPGTSARPYTTALLRGDDTQLVRPYLRAYELHEEDRLRRQRRQALWFATFGIDLDTRDIHGLRAV